MKGTLWVVATPIGNLEDFSARALNVLKEVDFWIVEHRRDVYVLSEKTGCRKPFIVANQGTEEKVLSSVIRRIEKGETAALVSGAGTPIVSDPGYLIVKTAVQKNIRVLPVPGPSAVTCALQVSGFPGVPFYFAGFLPKKGFEKWLNKLPTDCTIVVFVPARKLVKFVKELQTVLCDPYIFVGKEMTKKYEEYFWGRCSQILGRLSENKLRGEFTVVFRKNA